MRLCGALVLPPSVRSFEIPYVSLCHETVRHGSGGRDRGHSRPGAPNQAGAKELTQDLLYRPPIERKLSDEPSSNRLDTILADRNSDCHQPHDFALPLPMPLVEFLGALRVGDRGSVLRGRSGDGGAVPGSPETRAPSHGWRRVPRKRHGAGRYPLPTRWDFQAAMKGHRLWPLRSTQAVAMHQDGIGGRGHPVGRCRFLPDQAKFGAVHRRHGLQPRRSGPRRFDTRRRAVRKLRERTDPSRAFGGIKGATTRLTAPAYWKFESSPLQRRDELRYVDRRRPVAIALF